jgi:hypothetical protein
VRSDLPQHRPLKAFSFDPAGARALRTMTINVPYEPLKPGPIGSMVHVVDYDASNDCYYQPVDLDDPGILLRGGLDPSEADPRFHQQMVYAVVWETINRFKFALGRQPKWHRKLGGYIRVLPHAMQEANAFYSRDLKALAFGYFQASITDPGVNLPGQVVYTCLSHDIIAHEATHALIDGQKAFFLEPTSQDTPAFHEAFADIVALFQHFSYRDALLEVISRNGGLIYRPDLAPGTRPGEGGALIQDELSTVNPLVALAQQFGEGMGTRKALRSALGTPPNSRELEHKFEPHDRGAILVAAVFDAFFTVYMRRTRDLMRIARSGVGTPERDLHPDLANRLAMEATKTAQHFGNICIRALDYCPPVDVQFGDFLRALITADSDLVPEDPFGYRSALIEAFRLRGIQPFGVISYAEDSLRWTAPADPDGASLPRCDGLSFDPFRPASREQNQRNAELLNAYGKQHADALGLTKEVAVQVYSFHPVLRIGPDGHPRLGIVVELMQQRQNVPLVPGDAASPKFTFRGGTTLVLDEEGNVRYAIAKPLGFDEPGNARLAAQRRYYGQLDAGFARATYGDAPLRPGRPLSVLDRPGGDAQPMRFDLIHRGY